MKVKQINKLVAEIDGTEVELIPVTLKNIVVHPPSNNSGLALSSSTYKSLTIAQDTDEVVGYLLSPSIEAKS